MELNEQFEDNRRLWNARTRVHLNSRFYDVESFLAGANSVDEMVLRHLGELAGKKLLHLQCHFGQDTLSLARLGAAVTGVDISDSAIAAARDLAKKMELDATFILSNVLAPDLNPGQDFDWVFTSYGTIGWLPDLKDWAKLIARSLKPGGKFLIVDFHPVVWMMKEDFSGIGYSYFNKEVISEVPEATYTDGEADFKGHAEHSWNHPLSDILGALLEAGLQIRDLQEYDYSFYNVFQRPVRVEQGWQVEGLEGKLPMVYAIQAVKPG